MTNDQSIGIGEWTRAAGAEPSLRVGVILDQDALATVRIRLAGGRYRGRGGHAGEITLAPDTELTVSLAGPALSVRAGDEPPMVIPGLRLEAVTPVPLTTGAGACVREVVAGRGFHWQKHTEQTLTGAFDLLPGTAGVVLVNELPLEDYLAGVITAEMSGACPAEFLKAQCVVARSWLLALAEPKHENTPFDRCNDDCCQRYQGTGDLTSAALEAVRATRGEALVTPQAPDQCPRGVVDANYAKSCGGVSEEPVFVWGAPKPGVSSVFDGPADDPGRDFGRVTEENIADYLAGEWLARTRVYCSPQVVSTDDIAKFLGRVDEVDDYFRWTVRYTRGELEDLLREKLPQAGELALLRDLCVIERGVSGRACVLDVLWQAGDGRPECTRLDSEYRIREVLHARFLYSSAFTIDTQRDADGNLTTITLRGAGWGHGVGLCQIGALGMALGGADYQQICRHYYPNADLAHVYR